MKYVAAALGAALLLGGAQAASAQNPDIVVANHTAKRENILLRVPAQSDLNDPAAAIAVRSSATRAIEKACNPGDRLNADIKPDFQCRREMAASLELELRQRSYGG